MVLEYLPTFNWVILDKGSFVGVQIPAPCFAYGFEFWFEYCLLIQRSPGELNLGPWFDPPWSGFEKGPNADFSDGKCIPYYPILVHHGAGV